MTFFTVTIYKSDFRKFYKKLHKQKKKKIEKGKEKGEKKKKRIWNERKEPFVLLELLIHFVVISSEVYPQGLQVWFRLWA